MNEERVKERRMLKILIKNRELKRLVVDERSEETKVARDNE